RRADGGRPAGSGSGAGRRGALSGAPGTAGGPRREEPRQISPVKLTAHWRSTVDNLDISRVLADQLPWRARFVHASPGTLGPMADRGAAQTTCGLSREGVPSFVTATPGVDGLSRRGGSLRDRGGPSGSAAAARPPPAVPVQRWPVSPDQRCSR